MGWKMEQEFDLFDFAASQMEMTAASAAVPVKMPGKHELQQAAFAFLLSRHPAGIAANVPTRRSKYRVAAAGFWR